MSTRLGEGRALRLLVAGHPLLGPERGRALAEVIAATQVKADQGDVRFQVKFTGATLHVLLGEAGK